jgi:hypothetical protein
LADGREIDLVLSDIMMPGTMNGMELAREVRRRRPGAPLLLTTGYAGAAVQEAEVEGIDILCKPYAIEALDAALRAAFGHRATESSDAERCTGSDSPCLPTLKSGCQELAGDSVRPRKTFVQSCEREPERLGNGDVPRVVTCHVVTQFPDAAGEGLKRKQVDIELHEIVLSRIRLWRRD